MLGVKTVDINCDKPVGIGRIAAHGDVVVYQLAIDIDGIIGSGSFHGANEQETWREQIMIKIKTSFTIYSLSAFNNHYREKL